MSIPVMRIWPLLLRVWCRCLNAYHVMNGIGRRRESSLSKKPPWPGSTLLESYRDDS